MGCCCCCCCFIGRAGIGVGVFAGLRDTGLIGGVRGLVDVGVMVGIVSGVVLKRLGGSGGEAGIFIS